MIYLVIAYTGDYYVPEELYAVCDTYENAQRLLDNCLKEKRYRSDGSYWIPYEDAEIREVELNKSI